MAFVGPTGVGKTTTIAKLAAVSALTERRRVALITLDTYRIAAAEQLKVYGNIIGTPVIVASDREEFSQALRQTREEEAEEMIRQFCVIPLQSLLFTRPAGAGRFRGRDSGTDR